MYINGFSFYFCKAISPFGAPLIISQVALWIGL